VPDKDLDLMSARHRALGQVDIPPYQTQTLQAPVDRITGFDLKKKDGNQLPEDSPAG